MAGNAAELNCIVKAQQAAGYISLNNLESSASEPAPPSPALEGQAKENQPGIVPGVEKSRADIIEKLTVTRAARGKASDAPHRGSEETRQGLSTATCAL